MIQYRLLWYENIGGRLIPFTGRVHTLIDPVQYQRESKDMNYKHLMIEARVAFDPDSEWPDPRMEVA